MWIYVQLRCVLLRMLITKLQIRTYEAKLFPLENYEPPWNNRKWTCIYYKNEYIAFSTGLGISVRYGAVEFFYGMFVLMIDLPVLMNGTEYIYISFLYLCVICIISYSLSLQTNAHSL